MAREDWRKTTCNQCSVYANCTIAGGCRREAARLMRQEEFEAAVQAHWQAELDAREPKRLIPLS